MVGSPQGVRTTGIDCVRLAYATAMLYGSARYSSRAALRSFGFDFLRVFCFLLVR
jgi:hypothetical protein